jgi:excisionase family DNA binding protein
MEPVLITVEEFGQATHIGRTRVYDLIRAGTIRSVSVGRSRRIPVEALAEFVRTLEAEAEGGSSS